MIKIPRPSKEELERERMCYAGICPQCASKILLILTTASDGCWSEHFRCVNCDFLYPNLSLTRRDCQHFKEIDEKGMIVTDIKEISNRERWEVSPA